jgi:membrane protein
MLSKLPAVLKSTVMGYINDDCLSRGAAIAFYTVFSLAPVLVIVTAVAAVAFDEAAARGAILSQIRGVVGERGASAVQAMLTSAGAHRSGLLGGAIGTRGGRPNSDRPISGISA